VFTSVAYAAGSGGAGADQLISLAPFILIFVIFYFLLIRPQQKKAKEHTKFLEALKAGDEVVTSGGLFGKIAKVDGNTVVLEIADKVKVNVVKANLNRVGGSGGEK